MAEFLKEQAETLRQKARKHLQGIVRKHVAAMGNAINENAIRETIARAIPDFFEPELIEMARVFDQRVTTSNIASFFKMLYKTVLQKIH
ncbi:hypothetical protein [Neomoorella humiferrea]|uniref:Uncharacterized protein n=1 Tax=Neomoorella humiferrea TaxID=676965 RepID=A0A2T0AVR2_9FIRM|nr:hypothetical protein [Moorella humiferrea]PRR74745.1 hypothetical protein MOHU_07260 [Moorella humiferrea]